MTKHVTQRKIWKIGIFAVLSLAILVSSSCKGSSDPDILANIIAQNLCGAAVDIFMDDVYQFSVEFATDETIYDVSFGTYNLEARKKGEEAVVYSDTMEITQSLNYIVVIEGPSYIVIENKYGESLSGWRRQGHRQGDFRHTRVGLHPNRRRGGGRNTHPRG